MAFQNSFWEALASYLKNFVLFKRRRVTTLFLAALYFWKDAVLLHFFAARKSAFRLLIACTKVLFSQGRFFQDLRVTWGMQRSIICINTFFQLSQEVLMSPVNMRSHSVFSSNSLARLKSA